MTYQALSAAEFDDLLEEIFQELMRARSCYEAWWGLKRRETRTRFGKAISSHSEFFRVCIHAFFVGMLLAICRLFDDDPASCSLRKVRTNLRKELGFSREDVSKFKVAISAVEERVKKLINLRNALFAHRSHGATAEEEFADAGLKYQDPRIVLDSALRALNGAMRVRGKGQYSWDDAVINDLEKLLAEI